MVSLHTVRRILPGTYEGMPTKFSSQSWYCIIRDAYWTKDHNERRKSNNIDHGISYVMTTTQIKETATCRHACKLTVHRMQAVRILPPAMKSISSADFFSIATSSTRGHSLKLQKQHSSVDARTFYFSNRVVDAWNHLPDHVVNAASLSSFKRRLSLTTVY